MLVPVKCLALKNCVIERFHECILLLKLEIVSMSDKIGYVLNLKHQFDEKRKRCYFNAIINRFHKVCDENLS